MDNTSDNKKLRQKRREARAREASLGRTVTVLMGDPERRAYVYDLLLRTHIFASSFNDDPYRTAFAEGERNVGLRLLADIMRWAPDQYIQMMREAQDREVANERRDSDDRDSDGDYYGPVDGDHEGLNGNSDRSAIGADE